jgi:hypothetical protein
MRSGLVQAEDKATDWLRSGAERDALARLNSRLLSLRRLASTGEDLLALGTAVRFIEWVLAGEEPDDHAQLTIGYRTQDRSEGRWVGLTVNEWAIELDETQSSYGPYGSDRQSETHAVLEPCEAWNHGGVSSWFRSLDEVLAHDCVTLDGTLND